MHRKIRNFFVKSKFLKDLFNYTSYSFNTFVLKNIKRFFKKTPERALLSDLSDKNLPSIKQMKQFKYFLSEKEKILINICIFLFVVSSVWFVGRIIWNKLFETPKYGGEYTEGIVGSIQYINPIFAQSNDVDRDISKLIFSGLFKIDKDGKLQNDLIKDYSIAEDGKTYSFNLKDNIFWHDGAKFTSSDVEFTFSVIKDANFKSSLYKTFQGVEFEKDGDSAFKLILPEPFGEFTSSLTFGILPEHLWQGVTAENFTLTELNKKPIGTGPFKYESFKKDSNGFIKQYRVESFSNFYDKKPYISKVIFKFYNDSTSAIDALNNGQIDGLGSLLESELSKVKNHKTYTFYNFNTPKYSALFFNPKQNALLKDAVIRQALSLAINKKELATQIGTSEKEAYGPMDFIINPKEDESDFEKAKKILDNAGWKIDPKDQILKKKDQKIEITITSVENDEYAKILDYVKSQWTKLGIVTSIEIIPKQKISSQVISSRQYQVLLYGQLLSYDLDPYPFWHSSQVQTGLNLSIFGDSDIDTVLEDARKLGDFNQRLEKYNKFQDLLKKDNFAIFLFRPTYHYILNKEIKGVDTGVVYVSSDRFSNITNWYLKTKRIIKK